MKDEIIFSVIARIHSPYREKFGIPRQSGLAGEVRSCIVFEPEYRIREALRGLEAFSHIWLLWQFSEAVRENWSPTVRPPRLGGNTRMGVFATRSPFRPNAIGLSCVKILSIDEESEMGPVIWVSGADLMDGTPILDIKPYIPYADCVQDAKGGFTDTAGDFLLQVQIPETITKNMSGEMVAALKSVLSHDPRPSYHRNPDRVYGMKFGNYNVCFTVREDILQVKEINPI